ncbi:MAG: 16S rRNA (cytosine(1402)-N(4))-methyltransferase RsmH [Luteibaculaceae bacterium]
MKQENNTNYHLPVLLTESVDALVQNKDGVYVDVTFGGGGHSRAILERLSEKGKLLSFDQDPDAALNQITDERFCFVPYNFSSLKASLFLNGVKKVDGILGDLGVSSHQFDVPERGFTFRFPEAPLDMRMNMGSTQTAAQVLNEYPEQALANVLYQYGEFRESRRLASKLVQTRINKPFAVVADIKDALKGFVPQRKESQFYARIFQALRIEVNKELEVLKSFLLQSADVLHDEGRLVVISYHSLEDRLVKNFMRAGNFDGEQEKDFFGKTLRPFEPISAKAIVPKEQEVEQNPRARSAKLRVAKKVGA